MSDMEPNEKFVEFESVAPEGLVGVGDVAFFHGSIFFSLFSVYKRA